MVAWAHMKLSHLSDQALLQQTLTLVKKEKEILSEILLHLEEVRKRRLFSELGFPSLFQYCVKQLGYSEDQAYRRINALKLMKEMPEVQAKISSGELTLSNLAVAQTLFKTEAKVDRKAVLAAIAHKSKREAEKVVRTFSSRPQEEKKVFSFSLTPSQEEKWTAVKSKLAQCNLSEEEILEKLCDLFLAPKPEPKPRAKAKAAPETSTAKSPAPPRNAATQISRPLRREILARDKYRCTQCGSTNALQIDHKLPKSLGGPAHPNNLRILCRPCNQRSAIQLLGMTKMEKYLEKKP